MITVWGEGRGFKVVWMLEEMGLPYKLRDVDLIKGAEHDPEFMGVNPAGFIPALQDGDMVMVESIAIMEYLATRYGPTPLAIEPADPAYGPYLQFLHLGEAGLAVAVYIINGSLHLAPEAERDNWGSRFALEIFESRLKLVSRQLARSPYMAGDRFTAADISITYALHFAERNIAYELGAAERDYLARMSERDAYQRAMDVCAATKAWEAGIRATRTLSTKG